MFGYKYEYKHYDHIFIFEVGVGVINYNVPCIYCNINYRDDGPIHKCLSDNEKLIKNIIE